MKYITLIFAILLIARSPAISQTQIVRSVYFTNNSFSIPEKYKPMLKQLALQCASDSCTRIKIYGYADTTGSEEYDDYLSKKREEAVYDFMLSSGKFDTALVYRDVLGKGGDLYDLHFPQAHLYHRCVDIKVEFYKVKHKLE